MTQSPALSIDARGFDRLMSALEVTTSTLARLDVGGISVLVPATDLSVICYCELGEAVIATGPRSSVRLGQGSMLIGAAGKGIELVSEAAPGIDVSGTSMAPVGEVPERWSGAGARVVCGYFRATFGSTIDVFSNAGGQAFEIFNGVPGLAACLGAAVDELQHQQPGAGAMATSLLKQVIIAVFRQCMKQPGQWSRRFLVFRDPQIARAFGEMAARPGLPHTVTSLASLANLSRSAFMARFSQAMGHTPMAVLRDLRMHRAANLLASEPATLDHIVQSVGYRSRSGFVRAFRQTFGHDPWGGGGHWVEDNQPA